MSVRALATVNHSHAGFVHDAQVYVCAPLSIFASWRAVSSFLAFAKSQQAALDGECDLEDPTSDMYIRNRTNVSLDDSTGGADSYRPPETPST